MKGRILISLPVLVAAFLCCISTSAATNRALTVFIGEYPRESGWNSIASGNDKPLILSTLAANGFEPSDIICLENSAATYSGILAALSSLEAASRPGDRVYVHFSCHGQQITDQDGDEALSEHPDRYDEAIVPYDAYIAYGWKGYKGEKHLTDDILNEHFRRIKEAVGEKGLLMVVYDACHSGDMDRGGEETAPAPHRGTHDAFEQPLTGRTRQPSVKPVEWISFSACKSFQTNFEVEVDGIRYGRLSYTMSRTLEGGMTAGELAQTIMAEYRTLSVPKGRSQSPECVIPKGMGTLTLFK